MDDFELLPVEVLRDLADTCGRRHWKADKPAPAGTLFVQRSRVENYRVVSGMIRDRGGMDERTRNSVWASVCQAVDFHLGDNGNDGERQRAVAALAVAGRADAETQFIRFVNHRMNGGTESWERWMSIGRQGG